MTDTIEPGDLIREKDGRVSISEHAVELGFAGWKLIAKGSPDAPWTRHDGSATNPVPGAECQVCSTGLPGKSSLPSGHWDWPAVQFYRVTREAPSPPPAPQPGWVATVTIERTDQLTNGQPRVKFPGHWHVGIPRSLFDALVWSPPPPPPWEPEVGKAADWPMDDEAVTIRAIYKDNALVEKWDGEVCLARLFHLSPPKGGEA